MAIVLSAKITRSGKLIVFGLTTDTPGPTGYPPLALVTAVNATGLVVYDNGTPVTLGPSTWADGTNGNDLTGSIVAFYITSGPIAPGHTVTFDAPASFLVSNALATALVSGGTATNFAGLPHGTPRAAWGHFPALPTTDLIPVGWNVGQNPVNVATNTFIGKNRMLESGNWGPVAGSGMVTYDANTYPVSWTSPADTVLGNSVYSPDGTNGLANDKGYGNSIGVWTVYYLDSAYGTADQKSVVLSHDSLANGYVAISLASTSVAGNLVTQKWNVGYTSSNPTAWCLRLKLLVSAPSNTGGTSSWTISSPCNPSVLGNPYVVAPRAPGSARPRRRPTSPSPTRSTTTCSRPGSRATASPRCCCGRWSHSAGLPSTIGSMCATSLTSTSVAGRVTRPIRRPPDTSGSSTPTRRAYSWSSTRVYGPQAMFLTADATTYTLGVTLTAGSNLATLVSGTPQLCGSSVTAVSGTGSIPAGTLLAGFVGSELILDAPATASGAATLTLQHPGYLPLSAFDNGQFVNGGYGNGWAPVQLRFAMPHPFTTGQLVFVNANHNAISFTNGIGGLDFSTADLTRASGSMTPIRSRSACTPERAALPPHSR